MKKYLSIPNALSAFRIVIFPFLLYFTFIHQRNIVAWLFVISLLSDIADGYIARHFNNVTEFGSKLDSWGDLCNYVAALFSILVLCTSEVMALYLWFIILFALYFTGLILMLLKFRKLIGMHLYSSKITGYIQGFFLLSWLMFGLNDLMFYLAMGMGFYSYIEEIILILILKIPENDLRSLYWVLRKRQDLI